MPTRFFCILAAVLLLPLAGGCHVHPSKNNPSVWGPGSVLTAHTSYEIEAPATAVRGAIQNAIKRMQLEVRWSNLTNVDGGYIIRSARNLKLRIAYQAIDKNKTRIEIYRLAGDDTSLQDILWAEIRDDLNTPSTELPATGTSEPAAANTQPPADLK